MEQGDFLSHPAESCLFGIKRQPQGGIGEGMSIEAIRFRASEHGVILQVCERLEGFGYMDTASWRDAKVEDLLEVARYTRANDYLDQLISGFQNTVSGLQDQVQRVLDEKMERSMERFDQFPG